MRSVKGATIASLALIALALALALGACASSPSDGTFTEIYPLIFPRKTKAQCTFCHGLPPNDLSNGNLSVGADQASAYASLVDVTSTSSLCGGMVLVVPGDPDASLMMAKLRGTQTCGDRMPLGGDPLTKAQLTMVSTWISAGAMND